MRTVAMLILVVGCGAPALAQRAEPYPAPKPWTSHLLREEIRRLELEEELRYRRASDREIEAELERFCQNGVPPCRRHPPDALLREADRRGIIRIEEKPSFGQNDRPVQCFTWGSYPMRVTECF